MTQFVSSWCIGLWRQNQAVKMFIALMPRTNACIDSPQWWAMTEWVRPNVTSVWQLMRPVQWQMHEQTDERRQKLPATCINMPGWFLVCLQLPAPVLPLTSLPVHTGEDERVTTSLSVITALTSMKAVRMFLLSVDVAWNHGWHPQPHLTHHIYSLLLHIFRRGEE